MFTKRIVLSLMVAAVLGTLCGTASAGIEPMPFRTVISNRTDCLDVTSPFYNKTMSNMVLTLRVYVPAVGRDVDYPIELGAGSGLPPGDTRAFEVGITYETTPGARIVSWTFRAGIDPVPFHEVFAYESPDSIEAVEPPSLPAAYLTGSMPVLGFASPGVLVGTVALESELLYEACPAIPDQGYEWKNHGHYVRCVAHEAEALALEGRITVEEADAIVSAAAQSETGKK